MTALNPKLDGAYRCGNSSCGKLLVKCHNYAVEHVCNRCCLAPAETSTLCDYCRFNETVPDLTGTGNREKWARLKAAKRRLLYSLDLLRLPYGTREDGIEPPLSFDFKADVQKDGNWSWVVGDEEQVHTGHLHGKITINIREADSVEREKSRVLLRESHRTLVGHFRHEIAHYYWELLIQGCLEREFSESFGDHQNPSYAEAMQRYYESGPSANWQGTYISGYASMHPWEDFAETFARYLDVVSVLDTALQMGLPDGCDPTIATLTEMVDRYVQLGVIVNEINRAMGLMDLVPQVFAPVIVTKLNFVHELVRQNARAE